MYVCVNSNDISISYFSFETELVHLFSHALPTIF